MDYMDVLTQHVMSNPSPHQENRFMKDKLLQHNEYDHNYT